MVNIVSHALIRDSTKIARVCRIKRAGLLIISSRMTL